MKPQAVLERVKSISSDSGFNIVKTIGAGEYDNKAPAQKSAARVLSGCKSIILIGFGGSAFWKIFQGYLESNPDFKEKHEDLIDNYTLMVFEEISHALKGSGVNHKAVFPFGASGTAVNFLALGEAAGAGVPSLLGILLHPEFGPWVSLRGAVLTDTSFTSQDGPLKGFDPCPSCEKPCISACPASTISESGWDWESCMRFRLADETCSGNCASRRACPYGKDLQYTDEQLAYHHRFVLRDVNKYFDKKTS